MTPKTVCVGADMNIIHEMHLSIFFTCKRYDRTATQHRHASLDSVCTEL